MHIEYDEKVSYTIKFPQTLIAKQHLDIGTKNCFARQCVIIHSLVKEKVEGVA